MRTPPTSHTAARPLVLAACLGFFLSVPQAALAGHVGLAGGAIDTSKAPWAAPASPGDGPRLAIVQFPGPIRPQYLESLSTKGIEPHFYLPDHAYLVSLPAGGLAALKSGGAAQWVGDLEPGMKIAPRLRNVKRSTSGKRDGETSVVILSVDDAVRALLESRGREIEVSYRSPLGCLVTRVSLDGRDIQAVAGVWSVFWIEPRGRMRMRGERGAQAAAGNHAPGGNGPRGPGYRAWLESHGLRGGEGVTVHVADDGLDQGIATNEPGTAHPDILGRIAGIQNPTPEPLGDSTGGHGQINTSILLGNGAVGATDEQGFNLGQGVAPRARVYATKIFLADGTFDIGKSTFAELTVAAQDAGARFASNSWGGMEGGIYTVESAEYDAIVRDTDPTEPGNQEMTHFFSAGNQGPLAETVGEPGTAKNVITVGACENNDAGPFGNSGIGPSDSDDIRDLAYFSSRGPNADGRLGITLVAVGTHVMGAASTSPDYDGINVTDPYWPPGQTDYARSSGTSHATPIACGAGVLVHEFFRDVLSDMGQTPVPSPALVKAVLTATADDMAGGDDGQGGAIEPVPSTGQGWGRVNLKNLLEMGDAVDSFDQEFLFTSSGQVWSQRIEVVDPAKPLKVVLAWTDAPAIPLAATALVNDLDLRLMGESEELLGNVFAGGWSAAGGWADRLNNLEAVYVASPSPAYTLRVDAANIAGDGVPGNGRPADQDFAVFVWNGRILASTGSVQARRRSVKPSDRFEVFATDRNRAGAGAVSATVANPALGSQAQMVLSEQGPRTGLFRGAAYTTPRAPTRDDQIQARDGDRLVVTYRDPDDGSGRAVTATDTIWVDGTRPSITKFTVEREGLSSIAVAFETDEPTTALISLGPDPAELMAAHRSPRSTVHRAEFQDLESRTAHYLRFVASDEAGNLSSERWERIFTADLQVIFEDDFEGPDKGWEPNGLWHLAGPESNYPLAYSPTHSWWYGSEETGDYDVPPGEANTALLLGPPIEIPEGAEAALEFRSWEHAEILDYDLRRVFIRVEFTEELLWQPRLSPEIWRRVGLLDMSKYAGETIHVVFDFDTIDHRFNNKRGWYVDDVKVHSSVPSPESLETPSLVPLTVQPPFATGVVRPGALLYSDAGAVFAPGLYPPILGASYVRTASVDKDVVADAYLTFDLPREAWVVVAVDAAMAEPPAWLDTWRRRPETVLTTDNHAERVLYEKRFGAGAVTLGSNRASGGDALGFSMYTVILLEIQSPGTHWFVF